MTASNTNSPTSTAIPSFTSGEVLASADLNTIANAVASIGTPEALTATLTGTTSSTAGTWTAVTALTAGLVRDASQSAGVVTIAWGGTYDISYILNWPASTTVRRDAWIKRVSGGVTTWIVPAASSVTSVAGPTTYPDSTTNSYPDIQVASSQVVLAAGDTLQLYVRSSAASTAFTASLNLYYLNS